MRIIQYDDKDIVQIDENQIIYIQKTEKRYQGFRPLKTVMYKNWITPEIIKEMYDHCVEQGYYINGGNQDEVLRDKRE